MIEFTKDEIIDRIKEAVPSINDSIKKYKIVEYKEYYAVHADNIEPMLFEKENGFPSYKNFAEISSSDLGKGKVIDQIGDRKEVKDG